MNIDVSDRLNMYIQTRSKICLAHLDLNLVLKLLENDSSSSNLIIVDKYSVTKNILTFKTGYFILNNKYFLLLTPDQRMFSVIDIETKAKKFTSPLLSSEIKHISSGKYTFLTICGSITYFWNKIENGLLFSLDSLREEYSCGAILDEFDLAALGTYDDELLLVSLNFKENYKKYSLEICSNSS